VVIWPLSKTRLVKLPKTYTFFTFGHKALDKEDDGDHYYGLYEKADREVKDHCIGRGKGEEVRKIV
jgi:hypothetical protein